MPWISFESGDFGPYTRAFVGVVKVVPAGERVILPADRYWRSGAMAVCNVALYEINPPSIMATMSETFPQHTVNGWALQNDSLCAVMLATHLDGKEFWGAVGNLNTLRVCFPLGLPDSQATAKIVDMFLPKLGFGKLTQKLCNSRERQWRQDLDDYSDAASGAVLHYVQTELQSGMGSGKL